MLRRSWYFTLQVLRAALQWRAGCISFQQIKFRDRRAATRAGSFSEWRAHIDEPLSKNFSKSRR
jgi:hypothetical protein